MAGATRIPTAPALCAAALLFGDLAFAGGKLDCEAFPPMDMSPYVLPYAVGDAHLVTNTTGHYTPSNGGVGLYAVDFAMPTGTPVHAARAGEVVAIREHFRDGNGVDLEENFVFVRHADGTVARYFHLTGDGAAVRVGDRVRQGELIGWSGNTGQTAGPHLHFDVQACGPNLPPDYNALPCGRTLPVSFRNARPHCCGLKVGERYEAGPPDNEQFAGSGRITPPDQSSTSRVP